MAINPEPDGNGWSRTLMWRYYNPGTSWDDSKYDIDSFYNSTYGTTWFYRTWWYVDGSTPAYGSIGSNMWARKFVNQTGAPVVLGTISFRAAPGSSMMLDPPYTVQYYNGGAPNFLADGSGCRFTADLYIRNRYEDIHVPAASVCTLESIDRTNCSTNGVRGAVNNYSNVTKFGRPEYYGLDVDNGIWYYDSQGHIRCIHDCVFNFPNTARVEEGCYAFVTIRPTEWFGDNSMHKVLVIHAKGHDFNSTVVDDTTKVVWRYNGEAWERVVRPFMKLSEEWMQMKEQ